MEKETVLQVELPGLKHRTSGKVREIFEVDKDYLLIVATDRISVFDIILPNGIPLKGKVLTQLSVFWFNFLRDTKSHFISDRLDGISPEINSFLAQKLEGRAMLVKKAIPFPIECIVRGYLAGSAWKEYQKTGNVCGIMLSKGLRQAEKLPKPIFTPATKSKAGHDKNITIKEMRDIVGKKTGDILIEKSLAIYERARDYAFTKGIIISDTKFEFGEREGDIILIDEVLTPDSSRFWKVQDYSCGMSPTSLDKQFVRDYLESTGWNKEPPAPRLPSWIQQKTSEKYCQIFRLLTGKNVT